MTANRLDRALGALAGVAIGDALGMPSQTLPRAVIRANHGWIDDFVAPMAEHPASHGLAAAMVTDDTEQTLLLAKLLIEGAGHVDDRVWGQALLDWEKDIRARGLHDLLGPSTKAALCALLGGTPATETGKNGTTNGAAMRIAPVAIMTPASDAQVLVEKVFDVCRVTHAAREAIAAASAVARIINLGIEGLDFDAALPAALEAAVLGNQIGGPVGVDNMADRIALAVDTARQGNIEALLAVTGNSVASHEAIPAAFGIVQLAAGDPWDAAVAAANFGDDTDTIGAIACAMASACRGFATLPRDKVARVIAANRLELEPVAMGLLSLRDAAADKKAAS